MSAAEVIMTVLDAGGKFNQNSYKVSGGLHGVGVSVVNGLSDWLDLRIWRDQPEHRIRFAEGGEPEAPLAVVGPAARPARHRDHLHAVDQGLLADRVQLSEVLEHRLRELAFLNSGVSIRLADQRARPSQGGGAVLRGGVEAFVRYLDRAKQPLHPPIVIATERDQIADVALQWNDGYHETMLCFTNNIPQRDGGTHLTGFRAALTRALSKYAEESGTLKRDKVTLTGEDMREG